MTCRAITFAAAACFSRRPSRWHEAGRATHATRTPHIRYGRSFIGSSTADKHPSGQPLGQLMAQHCRPWFETSRLELIIPVPLHPRRLRWRGFNQSVLLGWEVGRSWRIPLDPFVLTRKTETQPQSSLSLKERQPNVPRCLLHRSPPERQEPAALASGRHLHFRSHAQRVHPRAAALRRAGRASAYLGANRFLSWTMFDTSASLAGCVKTPSQRGTDPRNRHSRESGNPGGVERRDAAVAPLHRPWIPAFAGMTEGDGNDGLAFRTSKLAF